MNIEKVRFYCYFRPMPDKIKLYNTYTRQLEDFTPINSSEAKIYCCGPTVYDYQHIGNFKTFINEDILVRTLKFAGYKVTHVMNITDVGHLVGDADGGEDKMLIAAKRENKKSYEIANYYTEHFFKDWDLLGLDRPNIVCKASDHIPEMIELIKKIENNGYAYQAAGNVYFDVEKFKDYGKLAKLNLNQLKAGARIAVDEQKKNPYDFALWFTKSKFENQELQWDSPWGKGYPGWHIECSAMSIKYLGEQFDIHCGGIDHIPVHHTNEIAQSESALQKPWVKYWFHANFILINTDKMSKSKGNFIILDDLIKASFEPKHYRFLILSAHYSSELNFSHDALTQAKNSYQKLKNQVLKLKEQASEKSIINQEYLKAFKDALYNDLNTPQALAIVWKVLGANDLAVGEKLSTLYNFDQVLGLGIENFKEETEVNTEALEFLRLRDKARAQKDWAKSDEYRDKLLALGYKIEDSKDGSKLVPT